MRPALVAAVLAVTAAPALAQATAECGSATTQLEMNDCAAARYEAADATLNAVWRDAIVAARSAGVEDRLRTAQRAWISFRDAACTAESALYDGGSIRPLVHSDCLARLTETRTADLRIFLENK